METVASVVGVYAINCLTLVVVLLIVVSHPDYVRWPSEFADGAERWWELADGWESTAGKPSQSTQYQACDVNVCL